MGADNCAKRFCRKTETKTNKKVISAKLESKLGLNYDTRSSGNQSHLTKHVRRFDFDSDLKFLSNFSNLEENNSIQPKTTKILQLKRIRRFNFSSFQEPKFQKEGYDLLVKLYGEDQAKEFSHMNFSNASIEHLKELLESLKNIPQVVKQWNQTTSELNRVEQIKKLNISKDLHSDEPELNDKVASKIINQLNNLDVNETRDGSYIYPYGDEPIIHEDANITISNWFTQLSNENINGLEKQVRTICYIAKVIMNTWKPLPWTKLIYGYYMARDLYRIFVSLSIEHLTILDLIQSILGITFDWNEFNHESMKLDEDINYTIMINKAIAKIELKDPNIFDFIKIEAEPISREIDTWIINLGQI